MEENKKSKITFSRIMRFIGYALIAAVYILIFGRIYLADNHGVMDRFSFDEKSASLYTRDTQFMTQTIQSTMDPKGYYSISNLVFVPEHGELQINVRYNDSTLDALNSLYPDASETDIDPFVFVLSDGDGLVIKEYEYIAKQNLLYNFRKLKFSIGDFELYDKLYLTIYPSNHISDESKMAVTFEIYNLENDIYDSKLKIKFGAEPDRFVRSAYFEVLQTTEEQ